MRIYQVNFALKDLSSSLLKYTRLFLNNKVGFNLKRAATEINTNYKLRHGTQQVSLLGTGILDPPESFVRTLQYNKGNRKQKMD